METVSTKVEVMVRMAWRYSALKKQHNVRQVQTIYNKTCVPSMIHSATLTVVPVAITILTWKLFFLGIVDGWTDVQQVRK